MSEGALLLWCLIPVLGVLGILILPWAHRRHRRALEAAQRRREIEAQREPDWKVAEREIASETIVDVIRKAEEKAEQEFNS